MSEPNTNLWGMNRVRVILIRNEISGPTYVLGPRPATVEEKGFCIYLEFSGPVWPLCNLKEWPKRRKTRCSGGKEG